MSGNKLLLSRNNREGEAPAEPLKEPTYYSIRSSAGASPSLLQIRDVLLGFVMRTAFRGRLAAFLSGLLNSASKQ
jgi:hypothetical protein